MALFNYATKEITLKIVYYGPGLSGKTTNLQYLHSAMNPETKGKLLSLSTEADRTLFFDFLPVELGKIRDFSIRFQLYTVPGQVRYNATRKVVLKGADAVVFVADSQQDMREQNIESFENMRENLISNNINPDTIPILLQFNKRDLKNILSVEDLNNDLNAKKAYEVLESSAINGTGVEDTFKLITRMLLKDIAKKHKIEIQPAAAKPVVEKPVAAKPIVEKPVFAAEKPRIKEPPVIEKPSFPLPKPEGVRRERPDRVELKAHEPKTLAGEPVFTDFDLGSEKEPEIIPEAEPEEPLLPEKSEPFPFDLHPESVAIPAHDDEKAIVDIPGPASEAALLQPSLTETVPQEPLKQESENKESSVHESSAPIPEASRTTLSETELVQPTMQTFPAEKINALTDMIHKISESVLDIEAELRSVRRTVSDIKSEIQLLKHDIALLKREEPKGPVLKDLTEFKELRREQKETSNLLKDVLDLLGRLKEKKRWFRL